MLNNRARSWKLDSVAKKIRQINWEARKILQVDVPEVLVSHTGQRIVSIHHSYLASEAKDLRTGSILSRIRGDILPEREVHVSEGLDSRHFRKRLGNYIFCMPSEAKYYTRRIEFKVGQREGEVLALPFVPQRRRRNVSVLQFPESKIRIILYPG